ncbi:MAG: PAS domain-containing protein [Aquabacterium sp.]
MRTLLDRVPALVAYWDRQQRNVYANRAYLEWFGLTPEAISGRTVREVLGETLYAENLPHIEAVLAGQPQDFDCLVVDAAGERRHTQVHYFPDGQAGGVAGFFVVASDVSDLKRARDDLHEAQRIGGLGSWRWCFSDHTSSWSPQLFRMMGRDPSLSAPSYDATERYLSPESWRAAQDSVAHILATGKPVELEVAYVTEDGRSGWMVAHALALRDATGQVSGVHGTVRDVTERRRIETELLDSRNKLRDMVAHHEVACEAERKHLAREVHDELGQLLTAMRMDLAMLRPHGVRDPAVLRLTEDMGMLLDQMFKVTRQVVTSLRPAALDAGLVAALEWLAQDFAQRYGMPCTVDAGGRDLALPEALSSIVFRVVQESLTNVARHADANEVAIMLRHEAGELHLQVRDDGRGFDFNAVRHQPGYGLLSMRERVLSLGGTLCIDSGPGRGTTIDIDVPTQDAALLRSCRDG